MVCYALLADLGLNFFRSLISKSWQEAGGWDGSAWAAAAADRAAAGVAALARLARPLPALPRPPCWPSSWPPACGPSPSWAPSSGAAAPGHGEVVVAGCVDSSAALWWSLPGESLARAASPLPAHRPLQHLEPWRHWPLRLPSPCPPPTTRHREAVDHAYASAARAAAAKWEGLGLSRKAKAVALALLLGSLWLRSAWATRCVALLGGRPGGALPPEARRG